MKQLKLIDVIKNDNGTLKGFFNALTHINFDTTHKYSDMFDWSKDITTTYQDIDFLDDDFLYNHSGELLIAPLLEKQLDNDELMSSENQWTKILKLAYTKYVIKWQRLWDVANAEYNPIENYNLLERETMPTKTTSDNFNESTHNEVNTDIQTNDIVYGFNSDNPVPVGKSQTTGSKLNNYSDQTHSGTSQNNIRTESYETYRELTRSGNIGVTTSQQMIESEIKLWQWNFIQEVVYKDLNELITLNIYGGE